MSLGVVIKGPEGVVLAADSRITITATPPSGQPIVVNFDNATKLLAFNAEEHKHVGVVTYGSALIKQRTIHSYLPELELKLPENRLSVEQYAIRMADFFGGLWQQEQKPVAQAIVPPVFIVGGYDEKEAYGRVFLFRLGDPAGIEEKNPNDFGMTWGGQLETASRLVHGFDPRLPDLLSGQLQLSTEQVRQALESVRAEIEWRFPYQVLPLQDCVNLATFLIRATITAQSLSVGIRGVGGLIEVAVITRTEILEFLQQKHIHVDRAAS